MKNIKRLLAMVLAIAVCLSLSGCNALDELRACQGYWQLDGSIRWGEHSYKKLPACEELCPYFSYEYDAPVLHVTADDVPVLLSTFVGESFDISEDELFLEGYEEAYTDAEELGYVLYCREDKYEEFVTRIQKGFTPELYFYTYSVFDEETYEYEDKYYDLTAEQVEAVQYVYSNVIPKTLEDGFYFHSDLSICLTTASADRLFQRDVLYMEAVGQAYYLSVEQADYTTLLYAVPTDMRATFDGIFAAYRQAERDLYAEDYEESYL